MTRDDLTTAIHELSGGLYGAHPLLDQIISNTVALHHADLDTDGLAAVAPRLFGDDSFLRLLALIAQGMASSDTVQDLAPNDRDGAQSALNSLADQLLALAAGLTHIADQAAADKAAWHLDPA
ncbi:MULTISPECIES: hypothetical protein [unclassified Streptomyces]|uniref:hypothetical protein n=1 Tax=unclassified Streptomyces TaxID=2593676 RepID=UPI0008827B1E|nr:MULTISPECIES: hypothetical protein [unclassified Streptomyces]PBC72273.1 hypothetical protein BX261_7357 [Streptomyces sp. 2321.6]SDR61885.1 hypothetical protein SAMN05216511_7212 [Streptomyces sp. KS_16]SEE48657.1 hypothetical protein SAMN05428940_7261 [Streptomyces sp. 2133.1]SNC77778.1 hypothetical protein SAMN06272741_7194 [Streptomyces sp. 2114.4]